MTIEKIVLDFLDSQNIGNVYLQVPETRPDTFVAIQKTGDTNKNYINTATIAIQSVSKKSLLDACKLNEKVIKVMSRIVTEYSIGSCHKNTDYEFTDTSTKEYRYQAVFDIVYYK